MARLHQLLWIHQNKWQRRREVWVIRWKRWQMLLFMNRLHVVQSSCSIHRLKTKKIVLKCGQSQVVGLGLEVISRSNNFWNTRLNG